METKIVDQNGHVFMIASDDFRVLTDVMLSYQRWKESTEQMERRQLETTVANMTAFNKDFLDKIKDPYKRALFVYEQLLKLWTATPSRVEDGSR